MVEVNEKLQREIIESFVEFVIDDFKSARKFWKAGELEARDSRPSSAYISCGIAKGFTLAIRDIQNHIEQYLTGPGCDSRAGSSDGMSKKELIDSIGYTYKGRTGKGYLDIDGVEIFSSGNPREIDMFKAELIARIKGNGN